MTPEELRAAFIKSRGLNINTNPTAPIVPIPVQTVPQPSIAAPLPPPVRTDVIPGGPPTDPNAEPFRMPSPESVEAWRRGTPLPNPPAEATAAPSAVATRKPLPQFPAASVPAIPNTAPVVEAGPAGLTLNSTPAAPGWAGTVGIPAPINSESFIQGQDYQKLMSSLGDVAKGMKPKVAADTGAATITPMTSQPNTASPMAAQLMAALLQGKNRGLTLTGR